MSAMGIYQLGLLWLQATGNITPIGLRRGKELLDLVFIQEILTEPYRVVNIVLSTEVTTEVKSLPSQSSHYSSLLKWKVQG